MCFERQAGLTKGEECVGVSVFSVQCSVYRRSMYVCRVYKYYMVVFNHGKCIGVRKQEKECEGSAKDKVPSPVRIIPHEAISMAQSLKPYARSLSHELRTPMQGVVGMLDVIMANAKEAGESPDSIDVAKFLRDLKESIEIVQGTSFGN